MRIGETNVTTLFSQIVKAEMGADPVTGALSKGVEIDLTKSLPYIPFPQDFGPGWEEQWKADLRVQNVEAWQVAAYLARYNYAHRDVIPTDSYGDPRKQLELVTQAYAVTASQRRSLRSQDLEHRNYGLATATQFDAWGASFQTRRLHFLERFAVTTGYSHMPTESRPRMQTPATSGNKAA